MSFQESFRAARWIRTTNLVLQALLIVSLFGGLNYLALHFAWRFDLTRLRAHSLSAETRSYLDQLTRPVHVIVTISKDADNQEVRDAYSEVTELLREYSFASESKVAGKVTYSTLDVLQSPGKARQLGADENLVIVMCGDKRRILHLSDLYLIEHKERKAFTGEQAITAAILDVASDSKKRIYFLSGHGEMDPSSVSPSSGLTFLADELLLRNFELDRLELMVKRKIPDDAALLILAGPQTAFQPFEQELLRQYMSVRAGRMMILIPPRTEPGLGGLISDDWGILVRNAIIYDSASSAQNEAGVLIFRQFLKHEVTQVLINNGLPVQFGQTRSVQENPSRATDEGLSVKRLIRPADTAWGELNLNQNPPVRNDTDIPAGVLGAAVASERVGTTADLKNFSVPRGRMVVFGCADFLSNGGITRAGNLNLALSTINWLVDRDAQLNVPARPIEKFQLSLSQQELLRLRYCLLFVLPGAASLFGLIVYWTRRH